MKKTIFSLVVIVLFSCEKSKNVQNNANSTNSEIKNNIETLYKVDVVELDDIQYPDNPDIGFRSNARLFLTCT